MQLLNGILDRIISPVFAFLAILGVGISTHANTPFSRPSPSVKIQTSADSENQKIDQLIRKMSPRERVGQLFLVGIPGTEINDELKNYIQTYHPGAFVLFGRNIKNMAQVGRLNRDIRALARLDIPPLIAVDEEGGVVTRISTVPPLPNALAIGQTKSIETAEQFGRETGRILRGLGFNMNLAPVLDVADPSQFSFIGQRSFGSNPNLVADLGMAISKGYIASQILPTAKHFPGSGGVVQDPHKTIASQSVDKNSLFNEITSFSKFIELQSPTAIMMSHYKYPALDSSDLPATYSKKIISDLLRNKLNYQGLVITDDLQMNNGKLFKAPEDAGIAALNAGADIVMLAWSIKDQKRAMSRTLQAINSGEINRKLFYDKLRRILKTKLSLKQGPQADPKLFVEQRSVASQEIKNLSTKVLLHNFTLQIGDSQLAMAASEANSSYLKSPRICFFSSLVNFNLEISRYLKGKAKFYSLIDNGQSRLQQTIDKEHCEVSVISILGNKTALQAESLRDPTKSQIILVNLSSPYLIKEPEKYKKVINLYFPHSGVGELIGKNLEKIL